VRFVASKDEVKLESLERLSLLELICSDFPAELSLFAFLTLLAEIFK